MHFGPYFEPSIFNLLVVRFIVLGKVARTEPDQPVQLVEPGTGYVYGSVEYKKP